MARGLIVALALLLGTEAGVPIPVPADVVLLGLGERAGSDAIPLWGVMLGLEVVVIAGTAGLFLLARRIGGRLLERLGQRSPRLGERIGRAQGLLERRGRAGIAVGRATPGLRTITVVLAATSTLTVGTALVALVAGGSLFAQAHVLLGYAVGPAAREALEGLPVLGIAILALLVVGGLAAWVVRRGRREGVRGWTEGTCPACLALSLAEARSARSRPDLSRGVGSVRRA